MLLVFSTSIWSWLERLGGPGLVLLGIADNSVIPMPGSMDALTVVLAAGQKDWWPYYALMATIGALIGGYITYALARQGGEEALGKRLSKKQAEKAYKTFNRFGFWSLFLPGILPPPVPFTPFLVAAGALKYSRRKFFLAVGLARGVRYAALAYLGSKYSTQILGFFEKYYAPILWTVVGVSVAGGLAAAFFAWHHKRKDKGTVGRKKESLKAA